MSGPSERDPGVTGRSSPGQYANVDLREHCARAGRPARARTESCETGRVASGASATNPHRRDASACGQQRVPKHARYTFISIDESSQ